MKKWPHSYEIVASMKRNTLTSRNLYILGSRTSVRLEHEMWSALKEIANYEKSSYSKEQEREADLLATYLLSRAGYDLKRAQNIMVVLSDFSGESNISRSAFLDTHPAGVERYVAWDMAIHEVKTNPSKLPYLKESKELKDNPESQNIKKSATKTK